VVRAAFTFSAVRVSLADRIVPILANATAPTVKASTAPVPAGTVSRGR
jgi:hypothetical protein